MLLPSLWLCATLSAQESVTAPDAADSKPLNVVFYLIDTCRADHLSPYGSERPTSPFLEKLGREGVVFERCFSQGPWTKPSMAALLTSTYNSTNGIHSLFQKLPTKVTTFAEPFKAAGYYTAGFSANPIMGRMSNYTQGFRYFREAAQNIPNGDPIGFASGSSARINKHLFAWMEQNADAPHLMGDRPLFLYVHSVDPHEEYAPAREWLERFADPAKESDYLAKRKLLLNGAKRRQGAADLYRTQKHFDEVGLEVEPFMDYQKKLYDADILSNDDQIETLLARLEAQGLMDNTLVIVTADHGDEFMEHGGTSHGFSLYNELIHVPWIVWCPGRIPAGVRIAEPVQSIDIYPTLLDIAGLEHPEGLQGVSQFDRIHGRAEETVRAVFSEKTQPPADPGILQNKGTAVTVIEFPWKFTRNFTSPKDRELPPIELYDLLDDPLETTNLVDDHPDLVTRLQGLIDQHLRRNLALQTGQGEVTDQSELSAETLELLRKLGYIKAP